MPARQRMTMRAFVQRNTAAVNTYGHKSPPTWGAQSTTPCYAWVTSEDTRHGAEISADAARYRAIMPVGTDVTSDDRLQKIEDRAATELFGIMTIDAVIRRRGHLELRLRNQE